MLYHHSDAIWLAPGGTVDVAGFRYPTRMALIRLHDDRLLAWSPVALSADLRTAVDNLGQVAHVVAPNHLHHLALPDWQTAYPDAVFYAAPGLQAKRADLRFDAALCDTPPTAWDGLLDQVVVRGCAITQEVVFFHRPSGTVLFTDLLQQFPDDWFAGWRRIVARLDLMVSPHPCVPRKFRVATTNRAAARQAVRRILDWPARSVVMAHGTPVTLNAPAFLAEAFKWLRV